VFVRSWLIGPPTQQFSREGYWLAWGVKDWRVSERNEPARNRKRNLKSHAKMKTLTKLTLTTVAALTLGATTLLAGPVGPYGPLYGAVRNSASGAGSPGGYGYASPWTARPCSSIGTRKSGGPGYVACTKAIKNTLACRLACR
jgi:hypothetical protein